MRKFVFWTGVYDIIVGISISCPWLVTLLKIELPSSYFWLWFAAVVIIYVGTLLVLCSRNLNARAPLVYWCGILKIFAFFLLAGFGFFGGLGFMAGVFGIIDLIIGLVYLIGLPKSLKTSAMNILLDR